MAKRSSSQAMTDSAPPATIPPPRREGLRERNKRDKFARIIAAAARAFEANGFEKTTMRDIAEAAGVATGTLLLYTPTKDDLLVLVFKTELEPVIEQTFATLPETDILNQILYAFAGVIEHHSRKMALSRPFLKDLAFANEPVISDAAALNARHIGGIADLIEAAKARGEIYPEAPSLLTARCSHQLFVSNLRRWVAGRVARDQFERALRMSLGLLLTGLGPAFELSRRREAEDDDPAASHGKTNSSGAGRGPFAGKNLHKIRKKKG
jgi:AcrR family transcriptional regulator